MMRYKPNPDQVHIPHDRYARFMPRRLDDLRPELCDCIGRVYRVMAEGGYVESGPYEGEVAITLDMDFPPYWVPHGDLEEV